MGILSKEEVGMSADGYVVKKGKTFFYGQHKVKVVEVYPLVEQRGRLVRVTKAGTIYADQLYHKKDGKYIGCGD